MTGKPKARAKHEEWTPHGPVEYETVECVNCGDEIVTDGAVKVTIGRRRSGQQFVAALCPYCADNVLGYNANPTGIEIVPAAWRQWITGFRNQSTEGQVFTIVMALMLVVFFGGLFFMLFAIMADAAGGLI